MRRTFGLRDRGPRGTGALALDFFSHLARVREICNSRASLLEKTSGHSIVIPAPSPEQLAELIERFAGETFGARAARCLPRVTLQ